MSLVPEYSRKKQIFKSLFHTIIVMIFIFHYNNSCWFLLSYVYFPLNYFLLKNVWRVNGFWSVLGLYKQFINPNPTELGFLIVEFILPKVQEAFSVSQDYLKQLNKKLLGQKLGKWLISFCSVPLLLTDRIFKKWNIAKE